MDKKRPSVLRFTNRGKVYELDLSTLTIVDSIGLQRLAGNLPWAQILARFDLGCAESIRVLFFAARRAAGDQTPFDEINAPWGEIDADWCDAVTSPQAAEPARQDASPPTQ